MGAGSQPQQELVERYLSGFVNVCSCKGVITNGLTSRGVVNKHTHTDLEMSSNLTILVTDTDKEISHKD